ncbi:MAG: Rnase Y domain-containing protein, partial [Eubacteriales bacterium]|nr:Rnase Y domain-containing protein [Eubacteriales bacterium]
MTSITTQLLAVLSGGAIAGITAVIALAVGLAAGAFGYWKYYEKKVGTAKSEADKVKAEAAKIIEDAKVEAKTARKEALLEAKEEEHRLRAEIDKEAKERKAEYQKTEQRLQSKESYLDKKDDALDKKQEQLEVQRKQLQSKEEELQNIEDKLKNSQFLLEKELERISGMTRDEAKQQLMDALIDSAKKDAVQTAKQIEAEAKENAEKKAQNIISLAIQRCAADHTTDTTVSVVALPNDEMKGRIIGRVGRNIRALESATGVDLIIDDTPDVVTLSGFDPVRREIARITLEKLIQDGRIHPARIEEMVDKVKKEVDGLIKEAGENAVFECGIYGIHPEL